MGKMVKLKNLPGAASSIGWFKIKILLLVIQKKQGHTIIMFVISDWRLITLCGTVGLLDGFVCLLKDRVVRIGLFEKFMTGGFATGLLKLVYCMPSR